MHFDTKKLTRCALIAAIYVALTMLSNALNLAYGPIQLRFSEAMTVLPFLMPEASWGLFIGCVLSNILSPYGPLDMIVGSAATLLAALLTARCRNKWTAALPPVLCSHPHRRAHRLGGSGRRQRLPARVLLQRPHRRPRRSCRLLCPRHPPPRRDAEAPQAQLSQKRGLPNGSPLFYLRKH